jgi:hypothetical protein
MIIKKVYTGNVKAMLNANGVDTNKLRAINTKTRQVHNNQGFITWLIANNGKRDNGRFAKLAK